MNIRSQRLWLLTTAVVLTASAGHASRPQAAATKAAPVAQSSQGPAERQFRAWLNAFNAGDRAKYEAFLRERFPSRTARLDGDMDFLLRTGGFDLRRIESVTATTITCLVQERAWEQSRGRSLRSSPRRLTASCGSG